MSRPQGIHRSLAPRWAASLLLLGALVFATSALAAPARGARPRLEDEELERLARPRPTLALPQGWLLGQPVRFPRQLLPLLMGEREAGISEPEDDPVTVLRGLGNEPEHPVAPAFGGNRIANDVALDPAATTNSENSLAAFGRFMVAGWNDSFDPGGPRSFSGFAYSADGGRTWKDGGILPHGADDQVLGDPSITVDAHGNFFYASLYATPTLNLSVAVNRGRFVNDVMVFEPAALAVAAGPADGLDKEWIAVDPDDGTLYISYTRFLDAGGDQIELIRSRDGGRTWSAPLVLTDVNTESVQGSRPVVGPDHEVYVVYTVTDLTDFNSHMRIRKSENRGRSFGRKVNIGEAPGDVSIYPNFVTGPPGFNRAGGVEFPSIAVNHGGHGKGDVYVTWNEAVDYFDDLLGTAGTTVAEVETNNTAAGATPFTLGQTLTGRYDNSTDLDFFSFSGHAGETVLFFLVPAPGAQAEGFLRLFAPGGGVGDRLAFSSFGGGQAFITFTLPSDGTYYIRPGILNAQAKQGPYVLFTGTHVPSPRDVAKDARDVVLSRSHDGIHWTPRVRVNDDAPRYDNAFAEVATDRQGDVHLVWYDHRGDAQNGVLTDLYHARSRDGGRTFEPNTRVNDGPGINWNLIPSRLAPNMGDYIALSSDGDNVYALWADGRLGTPDSWLMRVAGGDRDGDDDGEDDDHAAMARASAGEGGVAMALRVANPAHARSAVGMSFDLPHASAVHLALYSVTGQRVATLIDGVRAAGAQQVTWDARGRDGAPAAPGLYFAVLKAAGAEVRQRVVLLQ